MAKQNSPRLSPTGRMTTRRIAPSLFSGILLCVIAAVSLGLTLLSSTMYKVDAALQQASPLAGDQEQSSADKGISESAMQQIQALIEEKESRTPAQQKIDSQLLYAMKMRQGQMIARGIEKLNTEVATDDDGRTVVDISARVTGRLLRRLRANGAYVMYSDARYNAIQALAPLDRLESIASLEGVTFVQPKQQYMTTSYQMDKQQNRRTADDMPAGFAERAERVRDVVTQALKQHESGGGFTTQSVGSKSTEGDVTHKAATARGTFGVSGSGVKIGVLSNGVVNLAASQALGDLGPVTVLPGQTGTGDEGTAMLEIIHDLAPAADLFFATANPTITQFAQNIRDLRTAGCDIIVDDVFYFVESPFQDGAPGPTNTNGGAVIQAVNDVVAAGAMYFSSAGNSGNKNDNTSGTWEGDFVDGGASASPLPLTGNVHNFGGQNFDVIQANGSQINLYWSDPLGGSSNDYDLFILNSTGTTVLASSTNIQNGTQDPFEVTGTGVNLRIVVLKKTGAAARFLHVDANRGRLSINTPGQTHGHAGATGAFGVAATPAATPLGAAPNPTGPFPGPFNATNTVELFSSDGPRRIFYNANSTPITPGDVSSTGGTLLQKPDITAADGVMVTGVGGFPSPFFGTSAAAPHAAAIAGLIKSAGSFTNAQIRTALTSTAIDIEAAGVDRDAGAGIVMAFEALNSLGVPGQANLELGTVTAMENPGDADGALEPGEGGKLTIQLKNSGVLDATGIIATLTTVTPGVTVTAPGTSAYPDLPALTGQANNTTPLAFTMSSTFPCAAPISFTLTVSYAGGPSPRVFTFTVPTSPPPTVITSTLDATAPAGGTGFTGATGTQTGRVFRANPPGACGVTKTFPGTGDLLSHQFDAYTFTTCPSTASYCVTITLTNGCTGNKQLFDAVYLNSFNPASIGTNYLTDAAASNTVGGPITFSATIPAGSSFVVVVADVNTGANSAVGCSYTLSVSGACLSCDTTNQVPVAMCQDVTVSAGASCTASAAIDNGSFDPDGGMLTLTQSPAGPYPLGTTSVLLTVVDDKGATSQCTANVTVTDNTPPSISCPGNMTTSTDANQCSAVVSFSDPTATDNCPAIGSTSCSPASGASFPKGTTTVTCSVSDAAGNAASCSFTVTVNDTQPPSITCPANIVKSTDANQCSAIVTYTTPTPADNCPGATTACLPNSGSTFPKGVTTVTCTTTDSSGNTASCSFTVTVNDTQPPSITCPSAVTAVTAVTCPISTSTVVNYPSPVISDNCPGVTAACVPPSGSSFSVGTTTVTCTATDTSANTKSCTFTVSVFNGCLQDDSNSTVKLLIDTVHGAYRFSCGGTLYTGIGTIAAGGCTFSLSHDASDRRVRASFNTSTKSATASLQSPPGTSRCTITDRNIMNNNCVAAP